MKISGLDFSESGEETVAWLAQFGADEPLAYKLLSLIRRVSADEFESAMLSLIKKRIGSGETPVGLYSERAIRTWKGAPNRLFNENKKPRRSVGLGPQPIISENKKYPEVGSEGKTANLITQSVRDFPGYAFSHPGPDVIRDKKSGASLLSPTLSEAATEYRNTCSPPGGLLALKAGTQENCLNSR